MSLIPRTYELLLRAVEEGVALGWTRAHKHEADPGEGTVKEAMERSVLETILEAFDVQDQDGADE